MADFLITYIGHISPEGQSCGLPTEIKAYQLLENVRSKKEILKAVEAQGTQFIMANGMAVSKDPAQIRDPKVLDTNRMFVYSRWILFIDMTIENVTNTKEQLDAYENGTPESEETKH
jgi:hypothetical protein